MNRRESGITRSGQDRRATQRQPTLDASLDFFGNSNGRYLVHSERKRLSKNSASKRKKCFFVRTHKYEGESTHHREHSPVFTLDASCGASLRVFMRTEPLSLFVQ